MVLYPAIIGTETNELIPAAGEDKYVWFLNSSLGQWNRMPSGAPMNNFVETTPASPVTGRIRPRTSDMVDPAVPISIPCRFQSIPGSVGSGSDTQGVAPRTPGSAPMPALMAVTSPAAL